jgi:hypothetical protein
MTGDEINGIIVAKVAAITGGATLALQGTVGHSADVWTLVLPLVSAAIGGGVAYGLLRGTTDRLVRDLEDLKRDLSAIRSTGVEALTRVATIEGMLHADKSARRGDG